MLWRWKPAPPTKPRNSGLFLSPSKDEAASWFDWLTMRTYAKPFARAQPICY